MAKLKYNVSVPIKYVSGGEDRTFWHNIGTAFKNDKDQFTVYLNSLPLPNTDGKCSFMIFPPKDDDQERQYGERAGRAARETKGKKKSSTDIDDEIPF